MVHQQLLCAQPESGAVTHDPLAVSESCREVEQAVQNLSKSVLEWVAAYKLGWQMLAPKHTV